MLSEFFNHAVVKPRANVPETQGHNKNLFNYVFISVNSQRDLCPVTNLSCYQEFATLLFSHNFV